MQGSGAKLWFLRNQGFHYFPKLFHPCRVAPVCRANAPSAPPFGPLGKDWLTRNSQSRGDERGAARQAVLFRARIMTGGDKA